VADADTHGAAFRAYLHGPPDTANRIDLREHPDIVDHHVAPDRTPAGRWPSDSGQPLALSQQFAVNTILSALEQGPGLFAAVVTLPFTAQQALRVNAGVAEWWLPGSTSAQRLADVAITPLLNPDELTQWRAITPGYGVTGHAGRRQGGPARARPAPALLRRANRGRVFCMSEIRAPEYAKVMIEQFAWWGTALSKARSESVYSG